MFRFFIVVALIGFLPGCSGSKESPPAISDLSDDLIGVWTNSDKEIAEIWIFNHDQTFWIVKRTNGMESSGSWTFEDGILKMHFGFGSMGQDLEIPIKIIDSQMTLVFDGQRELKRNRDMEQQYQTTTGRLKPRSNAISR